MNSFETIITRIPDKKRVNDSRYLCKCPAHDDSTESLVVSYDPSTKKTLMHCFAGCSSMDVLNSIGLEVQDLFDEDRHDYVQSSADYHERKIAKEAAHLTERAISRLYITKAWIESGKPLTTEEAEKADAAQAYLKAHDMLDVAPHWKR